MSITRVSNLEFQRWDALRYAIYRLIENGTYDLLVNIHFGGNHRMHGWNSEIGAKRFLPWHRAYLIIFERHLRKINPVLSIPYWDWELDQGNLEGFSNFLGISSRRTPEGERGDFFIDENSITDIRSKDNYDEFTQLLENRPHNDGHNWIGGDMADTISPRDPAFWFHHAQVDRIWHLWQQTHDETADLSGEEALLDPWHDEFDIHSVNDINALGDDSYTYV